MSTPESLDSNLLAMLCNLGKFYNYVELTEFPHRQVGYEAELR